MSDENVIQGANDKSYGSDVLGRGYSLLGGEVVSASSSPGASDDGSCHGRPRQAGLSKGEDPGIR